MSPLDLGQLLKVFVNTLIAHEKYPVQDCKNLHLPIQMQLSEKQKNFFLNFLFHLRNLHQILSIFKTRMIVIANVFRKLQTVKNLVRTLSKERCCRTHFDSQHVKASQILPKYPWERFYHVFSAFSRKVIWKMSPLVLGEILGESFNTLAADGKYFVQYCVNLPLPIQMQLFKNQKLVLNFFSHFLNLQQILNILKQTMIVIANVFQKLQTEKLA